MTSDLFTFYKENFILIFHKTGSIIKIYNVKRRIIMYGFFNDNNPLLNILDFLGKMIILNCLWLVCCIPVVTIGASTSGMYTAMIKIVKGTDHISTTEFFKGFKRNFLQATLLFLIIAALIALSTLTLLVSLQIASIIKYLAIFAAVLGYLISVILIFIGFPLQAMYDDTLMTQIKNSIILAFRSPLMFVLSIVGWVIGALLTLNSYYFFRYFGFIWACFGCAFLFYLSTRCVLNIFSKLTTQRDVKETEEPTEEPIFVDASESEPKPGDKKLTSNKKVIK